jgi:hypothetical protein
MQFGEKPGRTGLVLCPYPGNLASPPPPVTGAGIKPLMQMIFHQVAFFASLQPSFYLLVSPLFCSVRALTAPRSKQDLDEETTHASRPEWPLSLHRSST